MNSRIVLTFAVLLCFWSCHHVESVPSTPEERIVRELAQRRVVMLGDFAHEFPLSYHTLTATLTTWLSMLENGESNQNHITLFLEEDGQIAQTIREYLKSGDLNPFLDFALPNTSLERLEFYSDLRRITLRIDTLNRALPPSGQIVFDVQGPEERNMLDPRWLDSSAVAAERYFVKDRDSLTAMNVFAYFDQHPNQKGLMFFGNGHLIKEITDKSFSNDLLPEERRGAWLARYLKLTYGDAAVFTVSQLPTGSLPASFGPTIQSDAFFSSSEVPWKDLQAPEEDIAPSNFDAFVIRPGFVIHAHNLKCVFSTRIIDACLKRLELVQSHRSGVFANRSYGEATRALTFFFDTSFATAEQWRAWLSRHPFEGPGLLRSERFQRRIATETSNVLRTPAFSNYIDDLIFMGYDPRLGSRTMSPADWENDLQKMWPQILSLNAIGVSWIGNSAEEADAFKYLKQASGKSFEEPGQILKWWRHRFFEVDY